MFLLPAKTRTHINKCIIFVNKKYDTLRHWRQFLTNLEKMETMKKTGSFQHSLPMDKYMAVNNQEENCVLEALKHVH